MKHFLKVVVILLFCYPSLYAQDGYKGGYILSLKGDTIKGLLLVQKSSSASENCVFKSGADGADKIYKPGDIIGYKYSDGKYYISKEISIDSTTKKLVFLEFLIKGMVNVYYYVDNTEHYYIEKQANDLMELTEQERVHIPDGSDLKDNTRYIIPSKFKGKLTYMMQDCPSLMSEIQRTRPNHNSLIKLSKDYHNKMCSTESCIVYETVNTSSKFKFGLLAGFSGNKFNFGNRMTSNFGNNFQVGATMKVSNFLMFNERINLKGSILFEKDLNSYTFTICDDVPSYYVIYNNVPYQLNKTNNSLAYIPSIKAKLNVMDIKIPITLNYDVNISKGIILNYGIGISNKIIISQNKNFEAVEFCRFYKKSINTLLSGGIATVGVEGNWLGNHPVFANLTYEYLVDFRSHADGTLRLTNTQLALQTGFYF